jgi:hypothetical protein
MQRLPSLAALAAVACIAASPVAAQSRADEARFAQAQDRFNNELNIFRAEFDRYSQARARGGPQGGYYGGQPGYGGGPRYQDDRDEGGYDPSRYYREDPRYQERVLAADDRVYRGNDGRYYCKRNDGTTGLIVGAVGGGVLGNVIDGGHSRAAGTLIGGALGALAGKAIDQNNAQVRCR